MPNEIYHRSNWGESKAEDFGDVYYDYAATNKLYNHSDYYENSDGTDAILRDLSNKASIVLTPTAYSDGSLNTVIPPYQVLPQELVTNGNFDTDSDWTLGTGWSIGDGKLVGDGAESNALQSGVVQNGNSYKITITTSNITTGYLSVRVGSGGAENFQVNSNGTQTFYTTADNGTFILFRNQSSFDGSIDNVSVKEIQEADFDFSRGSSATRVNEKGLVEDVQGDDYPRIDFTDGTGSLLLEPQSTNLMPYSEDFSQSVWRKEDVLIESGYTAPDGTNTAYKVTENGSDKHLVVLGTTVSNINRHKSIWARTVSGTGTVQLLNHNSDTSNIFTLTTQWQRFDVAHAGLNHFYAVDFRAASTTLSEVILWGAQLEDLSYATSYIPTSGSTVTRSADVANNSGNADLFNDSEGVLYAELAALADDLTFRVLSVSDGSNNNTVKFGYRSDSNRIYAEIRSGGSSQAFLSYDVTDITDFNKVALKYKVNDFALWVNGTERATDTSGSVSVGLDTLNFDNGGGSNEFYGDVKCVAVFKEALTDEELQQLTS